jgi:hypothetical protein
MMNIPHHISPSIPHVPLIDCNAIFPAQPPEFILERFMAMIMGLVQNIGPHIHHMRPPFVEPFQGSSFLLFWSQDALRESWVLLLNAFGVPHPLAQQPPETTTVGFGALGHRTAVERDQRLSTSTAAPTSTATQVEDSDCNRCLKNSHREFQLKKRLAHAVLLIEYRLLRYLVCEVSEVRNRQSTPALIQYREAVIHCSPGWRSTLGTCEVHTIVKP